MKPIKEMNIGELAAAVCTHLKKHGILSVLSGGACVTIYSKNQYQSNDLVFIETGETDRKTLKRILAELGFFEERRYFRHKDTEYFLEFPAGPLAIGSERVAHIHEMMFETGQLSLLSPTDCVKDRLAAYYHWNDLQALEQAKMVAQNHQIDLKEIQRWSGVERQLDKFEFFQEKLKS